MPYRLRVTATAEKQLHHLLRELQQRVRLSILALADDPRPRGCIKLRGENNYRIRIGDYRAIYDINDANQTVTILKVKHRRDVYRDL